MTYFEFVFALFSLLLGLSMVELLGGPIAVMREGAERVSSVATKLVDALRTARPRRAGAGASNSFATSSKAAGCPKLPISRPR